MTAPIHRSFTCAVVMAALAAPLTSFSLRAAESNSSDQERKLIEVIKSDLPPEDKALAFKRLAIYGTKEAVPALAPYLCDVGLASWARTALEAIPDPAADQALREALSKTDGRLLVGTINSIGFRRDAKAVPSLAPRLKDADVEVASAAAAALGRIGGAAAAKALDQSLGRAAGGLRAEVAEGCILCAERFLAEGNAAAAVKLYDTIRKADLPKHKVIEAVRGAILARGSAGIPLLVEQLRSADKAFFGIGLRVARELPGRAATTAIATELDRSAPDRQALLLLALGDRGDAAALPKILQIAGQGPKESRIVALGLLERLGDASCLNVLLTGAADQDAGVAKTARATLARLPGKELDAALLSRLSQSTGRERQVIIELAGQRRIEGALAAVLPSAEDADAGVRRVAVEAIGALGQEPQAGDLARLLAKPSSAEDRANLEKALLSISGRSGARCVQYLLPLTQSGEAALRVIGLHALASVGGAEALGVVTAALNDKDEAVQDEAVSTLSTWPDNWPDDIAVAPSLLRLAKSGKKPSHQALGLRGYLQYVQGAKHLTDNERLAKVNELLPLLKQPEEKRLALATLGTIPLAGTLELLANFTSDRAIAEEACLAIVNVATARGLRDASSEQRQKALQMVLETTKRSTTRGRAEAALKRLR